jgi:hypothetical protein
VVLPVLYVMSEKYIQGKMSRKQYADTSLINKKNNQ